MEQTVAGSRFGRVDWLPWGRAAFAWAADERRPVLLAVGAAWCAACAGMGRTTYSDPAVCDLIERHYVPVRVDADRRPDIAERYTLGGWPTTAFLTPDGQLLGGETYVDPPRMALLLRRVAGEFERRRDELAAAPPPPGPASDPDGPFTTDDVPAWLEQQLLAAFDPLHGGFGTAPKRLHAPALQFGLQRIAAGHTALLEAVTRTLDAAGRGALFDAVEGGAFRYCGERDWTAPRVEKLLAVNAEALELLLEGWSVLGDANCRERAVGIVRYAAETLADREAGGFYASQYADERYFAAAGEERARMHAPPVDRSVYAEGTSRMAAAFLHAAARFEDSSLAEFAAASLERIVGETYERGNGIAHAADGGEAVRGLLADQVWTSAALLDLYAAAEREVHLDMAQELMRFALRHLFDPAAGRFADRTVAADDVGLLRAPLFPFDANCMAVRVLARLARLTGDDDFRRRADALLAALAPAAQARGAGAAPWVLAHLDLEM